MAWLKALLASLLVDRRWFWPRAVLGGVLVLVGLFIARRAFDEWGKDLAQIYMAACLLLEGKNVYDTTVQLDGYHRFIGEVTTWGHFYPPGASVALIPATVLPYWLAREIFFYANAAMMLVGLWRFMAVYMPRWDRSLIALVLGIACCAACTRWGFKVGQPVPGIVGLFALFMAELKSKRSWSLVLCAVAVGSIKVTFGMPFVLIAMALRRIKVVIAIGVVLGSLNVIGTLGHGGFHVLQDYKANMATFERPDQLNYPDPRGWNSLARTDWPYLLNAIDPSFQRNKLIGYALTLLALAWLAREALINSKAAMNEESASLASMGPAAAISMLAVYHHHYDIGILLVPLLAYVGRPEFRAQRAAWVYVVAVGLYAGFYPYAKFADLATRVIGPSSVLFTKTLACAVCIVALVASCVVLRSTLRRTGSTVRASEERPVVATGSA